MKGKRVYLLDASVFIFKAWFSYVDNFHDSQGRALNAVYGYLAGLLRLLHHHPIDYFAVAFDESLFQGFRHQLCDHYKADRALPDAALAYQLDCCKAITASLGAAVFASNEFEADDLIATLARVAREEAFVTVLSNDKDLGQLVLNAGDRLWDYQGGANLDKEALQQRFQVQPQQIADLLALAGDASDNIPGVAGVGMKTAAQLLALYSDIDAFYQAPEKLLNSSIRGKQGLHDRLQAEKQNLERYRQLTRLRDDVPGLPDTVQALRFCPDWSELAECVSTLKAPVLARLINQWKIENDK